VNWSSGLHYCSYLFVHHYGWKSCHCPLIVCLILLFTVVHSLLAACYVLFVKPLSNLVLFQCIFVNCLNCIQRQNPLLSTTEHISNSTACLSQSSSVGSLVWVPGLLMAHVAILVLSQNHHYPKFCFISLLLTLPKLIKSNPSIKPHLFSNYRYTINFACCVPNSPFNLISVSQHTLSIVCYVAFRAILL
jgi:hypothetical protein